MLSPFMTVFVLAVLWLIVVVPMLFRRHDQRRRDRSLTGFGRAMRALGHRPRFADRDAAVFVPPGRSSAGPSEPGFLRRAADPARQPVPAAEEALMYPVDRSQTAELSPARAQMMARRRRSLSVLGVGTVASLGLAVLVGGLMWFIGLAFCAGLAGYLWFLRTQARRDRDRRADRLDRAAARRGFGRDLTEDVEAVDYAPVSTVRIDDDDLELQNMDTIDLTGVCEQISAGADDEPQVVERRAS